MYRRTFVATGATVGVGLLAGCLDGESDAADAPPYPDRIVFKTDDDRAPLSNPWFYKEQFTDGDPIEGFERPVWVAVFADWVDDYDEPTPDAEPSRSFELQDGRVVPISGHEPADDVYVALKHRDEGATLKFLAKEATAASQLLFDDEVLFDTDEVDPGATFELPP